MENLTLHSLVCSNILHSPFFSFSLSSYRNQNFIKFKNIKAKFFSSNFIYGNPNLFIKDSSFSYFIHSCLKINSNTYQNNTEKLIIPALGSTIENSIFSDLVDSEDSGAAINAVGPLIISNCEFIRCYATDAGAITAYGCDITIIQSTFTECEAYDSKGALELLGPEKKGFLDINSTLFYKTKAKYNGALYKTTSGYFSIDNNNFTFIKATQCVGTFEAVSGTFILSNTHFFNSSADVHHGCLVVRNMKGINISNVIWNKCSQKTFLLETSSCITFDGNNKDSIMEFCTFKKNKAGIGKTIFVASGSVVLDHCDFTGKQEDELGTQKLLTTQACIFEKLVMKKETPLKGVGYSPIINNNNSFSISQEEIITLLKGFAFSISFSLIFAYITTILHKNAIHFYKTQIKKTPLALL